MASLIIICLMLISIGLLSIILLKRSKAGSITNKDSKKKSRKRYAIIAIVVFVILFILFANTERKKRYAAIERARKTIELRGDI